MSLLKLYLMFLKIGSLMIGGGYSMLPLLIRELVERNRIITEDELTDYMAVAQCTPGVIAVNTATFVGYKVRKLIGSIVATLGVITVPMVLITLIAAVLKPLMQYEIVGHIFAGIRLAVCALITASVYKLFKKSVTNVTTFALFLLAFLFVAVGGVSPVFIVLGAAIVGLAWGGLKRC
ncbi:MAG: chromate transporter [Clostridia bacterium]|jgi:chromate transporter|nr:chromate transporter [Clostridia bacterium]